MIGLLAVLATACGGAGASGNDGAASGDDGIASATGGSAKDASAKKNADPQQAGLDFARCMREHGVDIPDPETGQGGFAVRIGGGPVGADSSGSSTAVAATGPTGAISIDGDDGGAFGECRHLLDDAIAASDRPADPQMADRALKFAQCMREHGVNMPDPQVNGGMVSIQLGDGLDPGSPTLQAAQEACSEFFGTPGGGGPGTGLHVSAGAHKS